MGKFTMPTVRSAPSFRAFRELLRIAGEQSDGLGRSFFDAIEGNFNRVARRWNLGVDGRIALGFFVRQGVAMLHELGHHKKRGPERGQPNPLHSHHRRGRCRKRPEGPAPA